MEEDKELTLEQKLKITIYKDTQKVCKETAKSIDVGIEKPALHLISEMVWKKLEVLAEDMEQFARHAKRSTINAEDIKLLVRRNPQLKETISKLAEEQNDARIADGRKKRSSKDVEPGSSEIVGEPSGDNNSDKST